MSIRRTVGNIGLGIVAQMRRKEEERARRREEERVAQVTPINQQYEQSVRLQALFGKRNSIQANVRDRLSTEAANPDLNIRTSADPIEETGQGPRRRRVIGPYTTGVNI